MIPLEEKRFCAVCGKELPVDLGTNIVVCTKGCRDKHKLDMVVKTNQDVKKRVLNEILKFLENKFGKNVDLDHVIEIIMKTRVQNIPFEDYVMTAYYLVNKEGQNPSLMIEDIVSAAIEWDDVNGGERTKKYKKKIENKITKLESILHTVSNEDNLSKVLSKIRKYKKNQKTGPKIGFNNKAYRSIQNNFHFNFKGIDNEVKSLILKTRERGDLDDQLYAEMLEIYEKNIDLFHGRNPKIVAAGIFFFLSIKENLAFDVDEISSMMNVSKASISDIERMISRKLQGQENDSRN